jgi:hypothetical protein
MIRTGSLFSQILSLFQRPDFARHVRELKTEHWAKGFSSWEQFVAMLFCQMAQARSLREITVYTFKPITYAGLMQSGESLQALFASLETR